MPLRDYTLHFVIGLDPEGRIALAAY